VDNAEAQAQTVYAGLLTTTAATVEWRCGHDAATNTGIAFRSSHVLRKP